MKKLLMTVRKIGFILGMGLITTTTFGQTQVGNSDFEAWGNVGNANERPTNWNNMKNGNLCGLCGFGSIQTVWRSTDLHAGATGTYSAQIKTGSAAGTTVNGNMTVGELNAPSTTPSQGYNISKIADANFSEAFTGKPDSLVVWVKYSVINNQDSARISAIIHDNYALRDPIDVNSTSHVVAKAVKNFQTGGQWIRLSIPFVYSGPATTPSFILISIASSYAPAAGVVGASLLVDDLEMIYVPKFAPVSAVCSGETFTLPTTSTNGITGTWSPAINNTATTTYTFTPTAGQHAAAATMTVTVNQKTTPTFTQVAPINSGDSFTLPTTSNNSITGAWSPAINNTATTTYTFTPTAGQCANTATMTVTVNTVGLGVNTMSDIKVFGVNKSINIDLSASSVQDATIQVMDLSGKIITNKKLNDNQLNVFDLNVQEGIYLISIKGNGKEYTGKVFLH